MDDLVIFRLQFLDIFCYRLWLRIFGTALGRLRSENMCGEEIE